MRLSKKMGMKLYLFTKYKEKHVKVINSKKQHLYMGYRFNEQIQLQNQVLNVKYSNKKE